MRVGADIGIRCLSCKRRVLLSRSELERRLKTGPLGGRMTSRDS